MRETQAIIERVRHVSADIQQIDLAVDQALTQLQPGHTVFAYLLENTAWSPYLRAQWLPVNLQGNTLTVEMTPTRQYTPGQVVSLLSPIGRPFPTRANRQHVLLIAEDMLPTPFAWLARTLVADGVAVTVVLSGRAAQYPLELLPREIEIRRSDTGWTWPDQVEAVNWADQIFVCAPSATQMDHYQKLLDSIKQIRQQMIPENYLCGIFYQRLACGTGACQACQLPGSKPGALACIDGPAVDLRQVRFE